MYFDFSAKNQVVYFAHLENFSMLEGKLGAEVVAAAY